MRVILTPEEARELASACIRAAKRLARAPEPPEEARTLGEFGLELASLTRASVAEPGQHLRAVE